MEEIWKPVVGYEGYYEVSNLGNVRSLTRTLAKGQYKICRKGRPVKLYSTKQGYLKAPLCKNSILKGMFVHRLVAKAFLPNPHNFPCINHKDENKANNDVTNLEWCSFSHNAKWNNKHLKIAAKLSKPVSQYDKDMNLIATYQSESEAARQVGLGSDHIGQCCRGKRRTFKGFIWRYTI